MVLQGLTGPLAGARRAGKSTFLRQQLAARERAGHPRASLVWLALEDAFLVRTVWMHSASARARMVNPRKVYPVDPGLIPLFERSGRQQTGRALETVVMLELERRGYEVAYVRTTDGYEVDFLATHPAHEPLLVQVAATTDADETMTRDVRALVSAMPDHPGATPLLLTMDTTPPREGLPTGVRWLAASEWLMEARAITS